MNATKELLIARYGFRCMLCERKDRYVQWHHIRPRYDFKRNHEEIDNSVENGSLLCDKCHKFIHRWDYNDKVYQALTLKIMQSKESG